VAFIFWENIYNEPLIQHHPKVINSHCENEKAIALAEELSHRENRSPEENALLDLLVTLIEKFEDEHYPIPNVAPLTLLKHLMEVQGLIQ
jgi:HTH-type transcriptional regulator / antitoxin HigA